MQLDTVERGLLDGAETAIAATRRFGGGELPLVFAAAEIRVGARVNKAVEACCGLHQRVSIDAQPLPEFQERRSARHGPRHIAPDRLVREREALEILGIENEKGGQVR